MNWSNLPFLSHQGLRVSDKNVRLLKRSICRLSAPEDYISQPPLQQGGVM